MKTLKLDLVSFLTLSALSAAAATHYVVPPGTPGVNPSGEFTSWATAATNIQAAVSIATNNSLVLVASGHYRLTNQIVIASAITLRSDKNGALDPAGTILDAQYPSYLNRCIYINNAAAVVEGFTLTNGYAAATDLTGLGGGAYLNLKGSVRNCVIAGNRAWKGGGGAYLHQGGVLSGCTVVGNVAMTNDIGYGGGAYVTVPHTIAGLITNCLFQGNSARRGGGVNLGNDNETLGGSTLVDCDILQNTAVICASGDGGAGVSTYRRFWMTDCRVISNSIVKINGTPYGAGINASPGGTIRDCRVAFNSGATYGGGIANISRATASNCVIESNSATWGGGIYCGAGGLVMDSFVTGNSSAAYMQGGTFRNCLFTGNGWIWAHNTAAVTFDNCTVTGHSEGFVLEQPATVENCIVYGNTSNWTQTKDGTNSVWRNSCTKPKPAGPSDVDNTDSDPRFVNAANGDFNLRGSSPCVNQGVFRTWMTGARDLQGRYRVIGTSVDMGAFEYLPMGTLMQVR